MSNVDHPKHYNLNPSGVECIDVIEHMPLNVGNAIKYLWRAGHKHDAIEDLQKAAWYAKREIERIDKLALAAEDKQVMSEEEVGIDIQVTPSPAHINIDNSHVKTVPMNVTAGDKESEYESTPMDDFEKYAAVSEKYAAAREDDDIRAAQLSAGRLAGYAGGDPAKQKP